MKENINNQFRGALLKIERAKHHIDDLNRRSADFFSSGACSFVFTRDYKAREAAIRFKQYKSIPDEFGLLIGDAIHNLRSALDLAVWVIVSPHAQKPENIQFPFSKKSDTLESVITSRQIQFAGPKVVQTIRDLKPYLGGNEYLYGVHHLDIADKHRLIIPVFSVSSLAGIKVEGLNMDTPEWGVIKSYGILGLEDGRELVRVPRKPPPRRIRHIFPKEQDLGGSFSIAFEKGSPFETKPAIAALVKMTDAVISAVENLQAAI